MGAGYLDAWVTLKLSSSYTWEGREGGVLNRQGGSSGGGHAGMVWSGEGGREGRVAAGCLAL